MTTYSYPPLPSNLSPLLQTHFQIKPSAPTLTSLHRFARSLLYQHLSDVFIQPCQLEDFWTFLKDSTTCTPPIHTVYDLYHNLECKFSFSKLIVKDLKAVLRSLDAHVNGKKAELSSRLEELFQNLYAKLHRNLLALWAYLFTPNHPLPNQTDEDDDLTALTAELSQLDVKNSNSNDDVSIHRHNGISLGLAQAKTLPTAVFSGGTVTTNDVQQGGYISHIISLLSLSIYNLFVLIVSAFCLKSGSLEDCWLVCGLTLLAEFRPEVVLTVIILGFLSKGY